MTTARHLLVMMGILSFLFGGCGRGENPQAPPAKAGARQSVRLEKPPEITSESAEGFHDLIFYIREHMRLADGTQTIRVSGLHKGRPLGLEVALSPAWQAGSLGKNLPLVTYRGTVTYRSTGPDSDAFVQVLDNLYGTKLAPRAMGAETRFTAITL